MFWDVDSPLPPFFSYKSCKNFTASFSHWWWLLTFADGLVLTFWWYRLISWILKQNIVLFVWGHEFPGHLNPMCILVDEVVQKLFVMFTYVNLRISETKAEGRVVSAVSNFPSLTTCISKTGPRYEQTSLEGTRICSKLPVSLPSIRPLYALSFNAWFVHRQTKVKQSLPS